MRTSAAILSFLAAFLSAPAVGSVAFGQEEDGNMGVLSPAQLGDDKPASKTVWTKDPSSKPIVINGAGETAQLGDDKPGIPAVWTKDPPSKTKVKTWKDKDGTHWEYVDPPLPGQPTITKVEQIVKPDGTKITEVFKTTTTIAEDGMETKITTLDTTTTDRNGFSHTKTYTHEKYTNPDGSIIENNHSSDEADYANGSSEQSTAKGTTAESDGYTDSHQTGSTDKTDKDGGQSSSAYSIHTTTDGNANEETVDSDLSETGVDGSSTDSGVTLQTKAVGDGKTESEQTDKVYFKDKDGNVTINDKYTKGISGADGSSDLEVKDDTEYTSANGEQQSESEQLAYSDDGKGNVTATTDSSAEDSDGNKMAGNSSSSQKTEGDSVEVNSDASEETEDAQGHTEKSEASTKSSQKKDADGNIIGKEEISGQSTGPGGELETMDGESNVKIKPGEGDQIIMENDSSTTAVGSEGVMTEDSASETEIGSDSIKQNSDTQINGPDGQVNVGEESSGKIGQDGTVEISKETQVTGTDSKGETSTQGESVEAGFDKNGEGTVEVTSTAPVTDGDGKTAQETEQSVEEVNNTPVPPTGDAEGEPSGNSDSPGGDSGQPEPDPQGIPDTQPVPDPGNTPAPQNGANQTADEAAAAVFDGPKSDSGLDTQPEPNAPPDTGDAPEPQNEANNIGDDAAGAVFDVQKSDSDNGGGAGATFGEFGPTLAGGGLYNAEPASGANLGLVTVFGGVNTSGSFADNWANGQKQNGADSVMTLANNTQLDDAANVGNQQIDDAQNISNSGGLESQTINDNSAKDTAKADQANSWGKALGDAVETGITEGGKSFGQVLGGAAADQAIGEIFSTSKSDEDGASDDSGDKATIATAGTGQTLASGGGSIKGKKPPKNDGGKRDGESSDSNDGGVASSNGGCDTTEPTSLGEAESTGTPDGEANPTDSMVQSPDTAEPLASTTLADSTQTPTATTPPEPSPPANNGYPCPKCGTSSPKPSYAMAWSETGVRYYTCPACKGNFHIEGRYDSSM